jgi:hypothetical protein
LEAAPGVGVEPFSPEEEEDEVSLLTYGMNDGEEGGDDDEDLVNREFHLIEAEGPRKSSSAQAEAPKGE